MVLPGRLTRFTPTFKPLTNVTPFTYRDAYTVQKQIAAIKKYLSEQLTTDFDDKIGQVFDQTEQAVTELAGNVQATVEEWAQLYETFMSDVTASLTALNDHAVTDLVRDETSLFAQALQDLFTSKDDLDAHKNLMDMLFTNIREDIESATSDLTSRLSEETLNATYNTRNEVNTKTFDGDTAHERLVAAVKTGEPVRLDENVAHAGNIPGFWDQVIEGTGTITAGQHVFTVQPRPSSTETVTNNIYVNAQTGSPHNDGLTPGTALDSLNTLYHVVLRRITPTQAQHARWVINMTGQFTDGVKMEDLPDFPYGLVFDGGNSSTTSLTRTADSTRHIGIWIEPGITQVEVYNIHFIGWTVGFNGYGVLMKLSGRLIVRHCEFSNNDIGAAAIQNVNFGISDNVFHAGNNTGISTQYNSTGQTNRNVLNGGTGDTNGIRISRGVNAHVDDNEIYGYRRGLYVDMSSRASVDRNIFGRNTVGVIVSSAAEWANNDNVFQTSNNDHYQHHGLGREVRMHSEGEWTGNDVRIAATQTNANLGMFQTYPNMSSTTTVYSGGVAGTIPAMWFTKYGKRIHVIIQGIVNTTTTYTTYVELGSTLPNGTGWTRWLNLTIPAGTSGTFIAEGFIYAQNSTSQRSVGTMTAGTNVRTTSSSTSLSMGGERRLRARVNPGANSSVNISMFNMETFFVG